MILNALAVAIISLAACAQAIGRAIVTNQCDAPIYLWSIGGSISEQYTITKDTSYSEVFHTDPVSGGIALKISPIEGGIFKPNVSQTIFAYNLDTNQVWYDMSDIFGDGFSGRTMKVTPTDSTCESITWGTGKPPAGSQVKTCQAETDLELTFCTGHWLVLNIYYIWGACTNIVRSLPSWYACGNNAPNETRVCCTHCIGSHHCVAAP
jgi:hypothetical protein